MKGQLKTADIDFKAFGISKAQVDAWEDGQRLDTSNLKVGEWEWWYSDGHLFDGTFYTVTFHSRIMEQGIPSYFMNVNIANQQGSLLNTRIPIPAENVSIQKESCDVRFGNHFIRSLDGLDKYELYLHPDQTTSGFGLHIFMDKTVPSYRPGTGFWENNGKFFAWLCVVPAAKLVGTFTVQGKEKKLQGSGYHDHNWGNCPMSDIFSDWLWSRGEVDGITAVVSSVRFNEDNGGQETKFVYLSQGSTTLVNAINDEIACLEGVKVPHPDTGKKISSDCVYIVKDEEDYDYIRFQGTQIVASFPFDSNSEWQTWYARYIARLILDLKIGDKRITIEGSSTLEIMDFFGAKNNPTDTEL